MLCRYCNQHFIPSATRKNWLFCDDPCRTRFLDDYKAKQYTPIPHRGGGRFVISLSFAVDDLILIKELKGDDSISHWVREIIQREIYAILLRDKRIGLNSLKPRMFVELDWEWDEYVRQHPEHKVFRDAPWISSRNPPIGWKEALAEDLAMIKQADGLKQDTETDETLRQVNRKV